MCNNVYIGMCHNNNGAAHISHICVTHITTNGKTTMENTTTNTDTNATTATDTTTNTGLFVVVKIDGVVHTIDPTTVKLIGTTTTNATTTPYLYNGDKIATDKNGRKLLDEKRQRETVFTLDYYGCTISDIVALSEKPILISEQREIRLLSGELPTTKNVTVADNVPKTTATTATTKLNTLLGKLSVEQQREFFVRELVKSGVAQSTIDLIMQTWKPTT